MKKIHLIYIVLLSFVTTAWIGCSDWTVPEANDYFKSPSDDYYAALRAYKKTNHQVAFGWFGNWTGEGASLVNCMAGIPDSVDFVSIWGGWINPTPAKKKDLKFCQKKKGTRFLICCIVANIGDQLTPQTARDNYAEKGFVSEADAVKDFWGWKDGDNDAIETAIRKYANAFCDTIHKYNYDGFDIDYEPNFGNSGNMAGHRDRMAVFIDELSKQLGPRYQSDKMLVVDGEPQSIPSETGPFFNYLIVQAYHSYGDSDLDYRLSTTVSNYAGHLTKEEVTNNYIVTENFESVSNAMQGGYPFTDRYGKHMMSLEGMARWKPNNGFRKGGCGCYHMEAEYPTNPEYKWMRNAIQIMNPGLNTLIKY